MSDNQELKDLMNKLHNLFTQHHRNPNEKKSLKDFTKIQKDLEALLFKNGMSKSDIKKHVEAIIDALKSEQSQPTAFSDLFNAINKKNVLKAAVPRPQFTKKPNNDHLPIAEARLVESRPVESRPVDFIRKDVKPSAPPLPKPDTKPSAPPLHKPDTKLS